MGTGLISNLLSIQPQASTPAGQMEVKMLPREYIMRNPDNKIYVVGDIGKLKEDIRQHGVRQPLEVIRWANGYKLIGGERRLTACEELAKEGDGRFESLPCIIVESKGELDDKIALITANATARDLTDGERLAQYEALKEALTHKKRDGKLEGKVRDEVCRILGLSTGAAARLNVIASCQNELIKERLMSGEIGLMQAYQAAQDYTRFAEAKAEELEAQKAQNNKVPVTVSEKSKNFPSALSLAAAIAAEKSTAADQTARVEQDRGMGVEIAASTPVHPESAPAKSPATSNTSTASEPRGHGTLVQLAQKTLREDAPWTPYKTDSVLGEEFYVQDLPGGAGLFKRIDKTRADAKKPFADDYAIILQDYSFFTCGWLKNFSIEAELVRYFELK